MGKQKIQEALSASRRPLNPQELEDAFNTLRQAVELQEAQKKAFVSLSCNLEGAAALVNMCINSQGREDLVTAEQLQSLREEFDLSFNQPSVRMKASPNRQETLMPNQSISRRPQN
ncbi:hypothetical protein FGO68_gene629 [Halteria grandinella]|uniref:Uncharacterized protein n=1 Tax=Halteria grandinella TaxID=5974 RepID=A0A8J8NUB9_HALGN|nr:hypothetical protein FGO68_gene629 [Halteria grandinella]